MAVAQPKPAKRVKKKIAKKVKKLTVTKVQEAVNEAIRERDGRCVTCGTVENGQASHFFARGGSSALRYHPKNIHRQCGGCHLEWHNRNSKPYTRYFDSIEGTDRLEAMMTKNIKLGQVELRTIYDFAKSGDLDSLETYIESIMRD